MTEFMTWQALMTPAGAVLFCAILTQLTKELPFVRNIPTRLWSGITAAVILIAAEFFAGTPTVSSVALCLVNACVTALAAQGAYDSMTDAV